jgi:uncharacterized protein YsxB (DUF464 family)
MQIIQPKIEVPDDIYDDYCAGRLNIMGLAKDADNNRVVKHLDTVSETEHFDDDNTLDNADNTDSSFGEAVVAAVVLAVAAITTITIHSIGKIAKKKVAVFKTELNTYIAAVNEQRLTTEIIDNLIVSMDNLKKSTRKKIRVEFSTDELVALVDCLCNHTKTLAQANNFELDDNYTEEEQSDILLKLRKNLIIQKNIFAQAA